MWMKNLRHAAMQRDWPRALLLSEECPAVGERLAQAEGLSPEEQRRLRERIDDVRLLNTQGNVIHDEQVPRREGGHLVELYDLVNMNFQEGALDDLLAEVRGNVSA
jgi:hypothetical protein